MRERDRGERQEPEKWSLVGVGEPFRGARAVLQDIGTIKYEAQVVGVVGGL